MSACWSDASSPTRPGGTPQVAHGGQPVGPMLEHREIAPRDRLEDVEAHPPVLVELVELEQPELLERAAVQALALGATRRGRGRGAGRRSVRRRSPSRAGARPRAGPPSTARAAGRPRFRCLPSIRTLPVVSKSAHPSGRARHLRRAAPDRFKPDPNRTEPWEGPGVLCHPGQDAAGGMVHEVVGRARRRAALSAGARRVRGIAGGRRFRGRAARSGSARDPAVGPGEGACPWRLSAPSTARHPRLRRLRSRRAAPSPATRPYEGLGTWIDIYDTEVWEHPVHAVRSMSAHGIRTIYLQSSNYNRNRPFVHPDGVEAILDAAHGRGIEVVAWYLPGFRDLSGSTCIGPCGRSGSRPLAGTGSIRSRSTSSRRRSAGRACGPPACSGCPPRSGAPPAPATRSARSWPRPTGWSGPIRGSGPGSRGAGSPTPTTSSCR